jgi:hypothetical protein
MHIVGSPWTEEASQPGGISAGIGPFLLAALICLLGVQVRLGRWLGHTLIFTTYLFLLCLVGILMIALNLRQAGSAAPWVVAYLCLFTGALLVSLVNLWQAWRSRTRSA